MNEIPTLTNDSGWLIIWSDIKDFGPSFWVFLIIFLLVYFKEQFAYIFKSLANKLLHGNKLHYTKKDLLKHPLFKDLDYWLNIGIKAIRLKNNMHPDDEDYINNKEKMAKEVIRIKYETSKQSMKTFLEETDFDNMDCEVARNYLMDCLEKNIITQKQKFIERGISPKFLNKFYLLSDITEKIVFNSIKNIFHKDCDLTTTTKMYLALNSLDGYLNIIFNNLLETIDSINGDLKDELFDGKPMCKSYKAKLKPPHPTYTMIVDEKLSEILRDLNGSRAMICKYFTKNNEHYHSAIYESTIVGVTSEIDNVQMICDNREKNILNIMNKSGSIAADISKFGANTIERLNARGVKGIIIVPLYNNGKIDGALSIDYISVEKFEKIMNDKTIDEKLKAYATDLSPYIQYPSDYHF